MALGEREQVELRAILRLMAQVLVVLGGLWLVFFGISLCFRYIRNGSELIYEVKEAAIRDSPLLDQATPARVLVFGNSKVLTGFIPDLFDSLSGGITSSFNVGLPDYNLFIDNLELICRRGEHPTHVLLLEAWPKEANAPRSPLGPNINDKRIMTTLFPFHWLPRDLALFVARARSRGGVLAFYRYCREQPRKTLAQRGYYFIEGKSHFPGDCLPNDFRLASDTPEKPWTRAVATNAPAFRRLQALAERYDFQVVLVPMYLRKGQCAEAPERPSCADALASHPRFSVVGRDYLLLPNWAFSDPVHLNRDGAAAYTKHLWELVGPSLIPARPSVSSAGKSGALDLK